MFFFCCFFFFFFFKQKTAYEIRLSLVGSEMCIRDSPFSARPSRPAAAACSYLSQARLLLRPETSRPNHHRAPDQTSVTQWIPSYSYPPPPNPASEAKVPACRLYPADCHAFHPETYLRESPLPGCSTHHNPSNGQAI